MSRKRKERRSQSIEQKTLNEIEKHVQAIGGQVAGLPERVFLISSSKPERPEKMFPLTFQRDGVTACPVFTSLEKAFHFRNASETMTDTDWSSWFVGACPIKRFAERMGDEIDVVTIDPGSLQGPDPTVVSASIFRGFAKSQIVVTTQSHASIKPLPEAN